MEHRISEISPICARIKVLKVFVWMLLGLVIILVIGYLGVSAYAVNAFTQPARNSDLVTYNPCVYGHPYQEFTFLRAAMDCRRSLVHPVERKPKGDHPGAWIQ